MKLDEKRYNEIEADMQKIIDCNEFLTERQITPSSILAIATLYLESHIKHRYLIKYSFIPCNSDEPAERVILGFKGKTKKEAIKEFKEQNEGVDSLKIIEISVIEEKPND